LHPDAAALNATQLGAVETAICEAIDAADCAPIFTAE
jgi:hypothetical protein